MSKLRIACTAIAKRIMAGRVNKAGESFIGEPVDVTSDCLIAVIDFIGRGEQKVVTEDGQPAYEIEVRDIRTAAQAAATQPRVRELADERALFEAWAVSDDGGWLASALARNPEGHEFDYLDDDVQAEWRAWQARAALAQQAAPEAPIGDDVRGPLTDAQRQECRHLYNNLKHLESAGYHTADDVIRKAAVCGYMNGRHDFASPVAAPEAPASEQQAAVGEIVANDPVHGWHMRPLVPWDQIGAGAKLYLSPAATTTSASGGAHDCRKLGGNCGCQFGQCANGLDQPATAYSTGRAPAPSREAAPMDGLRAAAAAVVARWDSPKWKDEPHTAVFIDRLRAALAQQSAERAEDAVTVPRATLELIDEAMNHMGDALNNMDAVEEEDEEKCTPAFDAIRELLAHPGEAPAGGKGQAK